MSDTPRTESIQSHRLLSLMFPLFARTLERELNAAKADLAQRTAERDEARRVACRNDLDVWMGIYTAKEVAAMRGWDCFTTHTNTPDVPVQNGGE